MGSPDASMTVEISVEQLKVEVARLQAENILLYSEAKWLFEAVEEECGHDYRPDWFKKRQAST